MPITADHLAELTAINAEVNLIPFDETPGAGEPPDFWTDQPMVGDSWVCRDFTEMKAQKLREAGWSPLSLTVVLCWVEYPPPPGRGYHAILAVDVDGETWLLDSRIDHPYPNTLPLPLPYTGDRRQIAGTTGYEPFSFGRSS